MAEFYDDFARADGALGGDWVTKAGNPQIVSGYATSTIFSYAVNTATSHAGRNRAFTNQQWVDINSFGASPIVKASLDNGYHYATRINLVGSDWYFRILICDGNQTGILNSVLIPSGFAGVSSVELIYDDGHLTATMNGTLVCEADDVTYEANTLSGFRSNGANDRFLDFTSGDPDPPYLTIAPEQVWFANPVNFLQAEIHNADWSDVQTPGTGLTADKGYVTSSKLETATIQSFSWVPLANQGTITITDPITGATGTFLSTYYPPQDSGQSYPLTEAGGQILNRTGDACPEGTILTTCDEPDLGGKLTQIRLALNGTLDLDPEEVTQGYPDSLGGMLSQMLDLWNTDTPGTRYTVQDVLNFLAGSPVGYSHKDIIDAIPPLDTVSNQDVIDAVHAAQGDGLPTIKDTYSALQTISTIAGYTLGDVLDAIGAIEPADLSSVLTAISNLRGGTATVQDAYDAANTAVTLATSIDTSLGQVRTQAQLTLQDVLDAIAAIPAPEPAAYEGPPVWPGEDNVTMGTPVALTSQLHITEPCDGVLFSYTTLPHKTGQYNIGGSVYYYGSGWIAFESAEGYLEPWQYLGFDNAVFTCKSMRRAGGFRATILAGGEATVTPWVKSG